MRYFNRRVPKFCTAYMEYFCEGQIFQVLVSLGWFISPLKLWVRTSFSARCTRYNIMW